MKKILLAVATVLAITSCSQNEEFENAAQKAEVNFTTVVSKAVRASELKTADLRTNGGFKVFAYNTEVADMAVGSILNTTFMDDVTVEWKTSKWEMDSENPFYWPLTDKIQFFSYSPITNVNYIKPDGLKTGYPSFTYSVADNVANQEDLVVAYAKNQTKPTVSSTPVNLNFKHILAQINFKLKGKDAGFTYNVKKITLSNINKTGTFTYGDPEVAIGTWPTSSESTSYEYSAVYTEFSNTSESIIATGDNGLMLIPQTLGETAKITIEYSTKNISTSKGTFDGTKEVSLKDIVWAVGDKILYTLSLPSGAESVTFTPEVDNWNAETKPEKDAQ